MNNKIVAFPTNQEHVCEQCRVAKARILRTIELHAQTANQLAQTEAQLVDAKREIRELKGAIASAIASIRSLGGNPQELIELINKNSR